MGIKPMYLLDTNTVSEPTKKRPQEQVLTMLETKGSFSAICSTVWFELLKGIYIMPEGGKKKALTEFCYDRVQVDYPIIAYDEHCAAINADIYARMQKNGTPVSPSDMQIAATALANNMIVVTRNTKDYEPIQAEYSLCVENWFE